MSRRWNRQKSALPYWRGSWRKVNCHQRTHRDGGQMENLITTVEILRRLSYLTSVVKKVASKEPIYCIAKIYRQLIDKLYDFIERSAFNRNGTVALEMDKNKKTAKICWTKKNRRRRICRVAQVHVPDISASKRRNTFCNFSKNVEQINY